ncbi:MAG TPA: redoxin domain-containing protein [Thermoanaerobaculia bacterium]|jgi:cytochrome c biogenesis protein CcmG/thiol:disulfide interchange protein DsbE|nr:redoxin domain-containing protein [Thermoanaerobaculia bacterium]
MNRTVLIVGIVIVAAIVFVLFAGLGKDPAHIDSPLVGRPAPPFALKAVGTGETIDLETLRGKPVVINFWATWCGPCYEEHPTLVANARNLQPEVQFIGVVFNDTDDKIMRFLAERGSAYPTLLDTNGKTAIAYGVGGVPETFFLNPKGTIVAKFEGPLTTEALQAELAKAMR